MYVLAEILTRGAEFPRVGSLPNNANTTCTNILKPRINHVSNTVGTFTPEV